MERTELEQKTNAELSAQIKEHNAALGLKIGDPGYLPTKGNKSDLIDAIINAEEFQQTAGQIRAKDERTEVANRQLRLHAENFRHEVDYYDPLIVAAFEDSDLTFFQELKVRDSGETTDDGLPVYDVVSGNRSLYNFRQACKNKGVDPETVPVPVSIRTYGGTAPRQRSAELLDIVAGNEFQRGMSPVDLMRACVELQKTGMKQSDIAEKLGKSQPNISYYLSLERLPNRVLDLIHFDYHAADLARNGAEWLDERDVPFDVVTEVEGEITEVKVKGISQANADLLLKLYPRRGSEGEKEGIKEVNKFISLDPEVIPNAIGMPATTFKSWLKIRATSAGIVEGPQAPPTDKGENITRNGKNAAAPDPNAPAVGKGKTGTKKSSKKKTNGSSMPDYMAEPYAATAYVAHTDINRGNYEFAANALAVLSEKLRTDEEDALRIFKWLRHHEVLVEV